MCTSKSLSRRAPLLPKVKEMVAHTARQPPTDRPFSRFLPAAGTEFLSEKKNKSKLIQHRSVAVERNP